MGGSRIQRLLQAELKEGEKVVWSAPPLPAPYSHSSMDVFTVVIVWLLTLAGLLFIILCQNLWINAPPLDKALWLGAAVACVAMGIVTPKYWSRDRAADILYAITDRRAITLVCNADGRNIVSSCKPAEMDHSICEVNKEGAGTIFFMQTNPLDEADPRGYSYTGFYGIAEVKVAEQRLKELVERLQQPAAAGCAR